MPLYTYRREDGSTFDIKQSFSDPALTVDPETGQHVSRIVHAAGIVFKGSGFYVNDSKSSGRNAATSPVKEKSSDTTKTDGAKSETTVASSSESAPAKAETKAETKSASKTAAD